MKIYNIFFIVMAVVFLTFQYFFIMSLEKEPNPDKPALTSDYRKINYATKEYRYE